MSTHPQTYLEPFWGRKLQIHPRTHSQTNPQPAREREPQIYSAPQTRGSEPESPPNLPPRPWKSDNFQSTERHIKAVEIKERLRLPHPFPAHAMPPFINPFGSSCMIMWNIKRNLSWKPIITNLVPETDMRNWIESQVRHFFNGVDLSRQRIARTLRIPEDRVQEYLYLLTSNEELDCTLYDVRYLLTAMASLHYYAKDQLPVMLPAEVRSKCMRFGNSFPKWKQLIDEGWRVDFKRMEPEYLEWVVRTTTPQVALSHTKRINRLVLSRLTKPEVVSILTAISNSVSQRITYKSMTAGANLVDRILGYDLQSYLDIGLEAIQYELVVDGGRSPRGNAWPYVVRCLQGIRTK